MSGYLCFKCEKTYVQYSKNVCKLNLDEKENKMLPVLYCSQCRFLLSKDEKEKDYIDWFYFKWYLVKNNIYI